MDLEHGIVFRLATIKESFPPNSLKLNVGHFELSERDKERTPPLLSVFEGAKTTVEQATVIRGAAGESASFGLRVEEVLAIEVQGLPRLRVLYDPLEPPKCDLPGADGHCGIEGLYRPPSQPRKLYRELRVRLADKSFRYHDGMS